MPAGDERCKTDRERAGRNRGETVDNLVFWVRIRIGSLFRNQR